MLFTAKHAAGNIHTSEVSTGTYSAFLFDKEVLFHVYRYTVIRQIFTPQKRTISPK